MKEGWRLSLHIWWANFCHWWFEFTHEPADDGFSFKKLFDDGLDWTKPYFHQGHLVVDTWQGRRHFDDNCPCVRDKELALTKELEKAGVLE